MADLKPGEVKFTYKEVVEALLRSRDMEEGVWGINVNLLLRGMSTKMDGKLIPTALVGMSYVSLQRRDEIDELSVDASTLEKLIKVIH